MLRDRKRLTAIACFEYPAWTTGKGGKERGQEHKASDQGCLQSREGREQGVSFLLLLLGTLRAHFTFPYFAMLILSPTSILRHSEKADVKAVKAHEKAVKHEHQARKDLERAKAKMDEATREVEKAQNEIDIKKQNHQKVAVGLENNKAHLVSYLLVLSVLIAAVSAAAELCAGCFDG